MPLPPDLAPVVARALDEVLDERTAQALHAAELLALIRPGSEFGRRARARETVFGPGDEKTAAAAIARVVAAAADSMPERVAAIRAAVRAVPDVGSLAVRARFGEGLGDIDFFELDRFVTRTTAAIELAGDAFGSGALIPDLSELDAMLAPGRVRAGPARGFVLADAYDAGLSDARERETAALRSLEAARERQTRAIEAVLGRNVRREEFALVRDEVPRALPAGVRVVRETPAYLVCTVESDDAVLEAERVHEDALAQIASIEARARAELARRVARHADALDAATHALGALDAFLARVEFTQRFGGCVPELAPSAGFALEDAVFVPLAVALADAGRRYVPISLRFARVAVLRGPNMGGKSAALRACGFAALCVALGVPPPARAASMPLFRRIAWIGGEGEAAFLSSFGDDVVRAHDVLASPAEPALVLVDEFARTTTPRAGDALVRALVDALARRDLRALVATHFPGPGGHGIPVLGVGGLPAGFTPPAEATFEATLAALGEAMDYRIVPTSGAATEDDPLRIAAALGLDPGLLARARTLLSKE